MQPSLRDIFSDTIAKVRQLGMWEKLTDSQKEKIVRKNILEYYNKQCSQQELVSSSRK